MENEKINIVKELILTLSEKRSLFSSKKLERFVVFYSFLLINLGFILYNIKTMEVLHLIEITALWLAYAGYNTYQNYRDKKLDSGYFQEES